MDTYLVYLIVAALALIVGGILTSTVLRKQVLSKSNVLLEEAREKAEVIKKEKLLQAKEKFLQLKSEHEKIVSEKNNNIHKAENRIDLYNRYI